MKPTILLVDDSDFVREAAATSLSLMGYRMYLAQCGAEAISLFKRVQPDITLLDIHLPDLSGFSVLKALRHTRPDAEVIFITGEGDMALVIEALRSGISDFVPKPLSLETLLPVLENAERRLEQKKAAQATSAPNSAPAEPAADRIKIKVQAFGSLVVTVGQSVVTENDWHNFKTAAVFKLLLIHHKRIVALDSLIEHVCEGSSTRSAEVMIFSAVSTIRRMLEPNLKSGRDSKYVHTHKSGYELNLGELNVDYYYDVEAFEALIREAQRTRSAQKYLAATELYRDEFLKNDMAHNWSSYKRQMLKDFYLSALQFLVDQAQAEARLHDVIELAQKMLQADELYEPAYTILIKTYLDLRRPAAAKKILELCEHNFRRHLNAPVPAYIADLVP